MKVLLLLFMVLNLSNFKDVLGKWLLVNIVMIELYCNTMFIIFKKLMNNKKPR